MLYNQPDRLSKSRSSPNAEHHIAFATVDNAISAYENQQSTVVSLLLFQGYLNSWLPDTLLKLSRGASMNLSEILKSRDSRHWRGRSTGAEL